MKPNTQHAPIGIVCSLPQEAGGFFRGTLKHPLKPQVISDDIVLCLSGMGAMRAQAAAEALAKHGVRSLISWGTCAGLSPSLNAGTLIVGNSIGALPCCPTLRESLLQRLSELQPRVGKFSPTDILLTHPEQKKALAQADQSIAADMESHAIAKAAQARNLPFALVRVISDTADTPLPSYLARAETAEGFIHTPKLLFLALLHPKQYRRFILMAQGGIRAKDTLKKMAQALISEECQ